MCNDRRQVPIAVNTVYGRSRSGGTRRAVRAEPPLGARRLLGRVHLVDQDRQVSTRPKWPKPAAYLQNTGHISTGPVLARPTNRSSFVLSYHPTYGKGKMA